MCSVRLSVQYNVIQGKIDKKSMQQLFGVPQAFYCVRRDATPVKFNILERQLPCCTSRHADPPRLQTATAPALSSHKTVTRGKHDRTVEIAREKLFIPRSGERPVSE